MAEKIYSTKKVWKLAINISLPCAIYIYSASAMNSCTNNINQTLGWNNSYLMLSIFTTIYPVGSIIGSLISAMISSRVGIKRTILLSSIFFIIGSILCVIPTNYTFAMGRLLTGVVGGVFITIPSTFLNEITPDEIAGQIGTMVQQACNFGIVVAYASGLLAPTENLSSNSLNNIWLGIIFFPAFACMYVIFYFTKIYKHESPGWLYSRGKTEEAKKALRFVYTKEGVEAGLRRFQGRAQLDSGSNSNEEPFLGTKEPGYLEVLCSRRYRKMIRIGILMNIGQQVSGSMVILLYFTMIFREMGSGEFMARVLTLATGIARILSGTLAILLLKKYGRKSLILIGQTVTTVLLFLLGVFNSWVYASVEVKAALVFLYNFCV